MNAAPSWDIQVIYFDWLYRQIFGANDSYHNVCAHLHSVEFYDGIPNDDNRGKEGTELRDEFMSSAPIVDMEDYANLYNIGKATVLEMLVALARRADFQVSIGRERWGQTFLQNLGLHKYPDNVFTQNAKVKVERIVRVFNQRIYTINGIGGIFPLAEINRRRDQRVLELWDQMADYMKENEMY